MGNNEKKSKITFISVIAITVLLGVLIIFKYNDKISILNNINNAYGSVTTVKNYSCPSGGKLNKNTGKCTISTNPIEYCNGYEQYGLCFALSKSADNVFEVPDCLNDGNIKGTLNSPKNRCIYKTNIMKTCPSGYSRKDQYTCVKKINAVNNKYLKCPSGYTQVGSSATCKQTYNASQAPQCSRGTFVGNGTCNYTYNAVNNKYLACPSGYYQVGSSATCKNTYSAVNQRYLKCPIGYTQVGSSATCKSTYSASKVSQSSYRCSNGGTLKGTTCTKTATGTWTDNYTCPAGGTRSGTTCTRTATGTWTDNYTCPAGGTRNGMLCTQSIKATYDYVCVNGGTRNGTTCTKTTTGTWIDNYVCPTNAGSGYVEGTKCILTKNIVPECPTGYSRVQNSNTCKKETPPYLLKISECPIDSKKIEGSLYFIGQNKIAGNDCYKEISFNKKCSNSSYKLNSSKTACEYTYKASLTSITCSESGYYYNAKNKKCEKINSNVGGDKPSNSPQTPSQPTVPTDDYTNKSEPLEVSPSSVNIVYADQKQQLTVKGLTNGESVTFTSENNNIATVDKKGMITPVSVGKTKIIIKRNNKTNVNDECIVIVNVSSLNVVVAQIEASIEDNILVEGESTKIVAKILPENATNKGIIYSSSNEKIATVDENGIITSKKAGEIIIYATSLENKNISKGVKLIVKKSLSEKDELTEDDIPNEIIIKDDNIVEKYIKTDVSKVYMEVLDTKQLKAKYYILKQEENKAITSENNEDLAYQSENENIATVSEDGLITATAIGNTNIKVYSKTEPDIYKNVKIIVEETKDLIEHEIKVQESIIDLAIGDTKTINILEEDIENLIFISANKKIAKVSSKGKITAVKAGRTEIIIRNKKDSKKSKTITVNVLKEDVFDEFEAENEIVTISLNYNRINMVKGDSIKVKASASDGSKLIWKSSNEKIVQVNQKGRIKAIKKGNATVTVYSKDNNKIKEKIHITVVRREKQLEKLDEVNTKELGLKTQKVTIQEESTKQIQFEKQIENVIFRSENEKIAKVDENGLITAISTGETKIMVTTTSASDYVSVKVTKKVVPTSIEIVEKEINVSIGEEYTLNATVLPKKVKNKNLLYASTNSSVAEVTDEGIIIGKSAGSAYVAAISEEKNSIKSYVRVIVK